MDTHQTDLRVLLSNDDGIRAPGIQAIYNALMDPEHDAGGPLFAECHVVAPLTVQSATSHGVTFHEPLMVREVDVNPHMSGVAVDGRPADCVKLALSNLWPERYGNGDLPELVISGMNAGANCGINTIYSGTVAAALEAAFLGVPSVAFSLHLGRGRPDFARAATLARRVMRMLLEHRDELLVPHACLNVNIPICDENADPPTPQEPDVVVAPMNTHGLVDHYEKRVSPGGDVYYWSAGDGLAFHGSDPGTDVAEMMARKITITPIGYDLTRTSALDTWRERIGIARAAAAD
jgi:5'-nucleotidase